MLGLRPSPAMAGFCVTRLDTIDTYEKIQDMKKRNLKLKGCIFLDDGRMHLIFHAKSHDRRICEVVQKSFRMRSFSSHQ